MARTNNTKLAVAGVAFVAGVFWLGRVLTRPEPVVFEVDAGERLVTNIDKSPLPPRWETAEPHVVAVVRPRLGQEIARLSVEKGPLETLKPLPPHHDLGAGYWGELAYETQKQFIRIPAEQWGRWNVTFESAWTSAMKRLASQSSTPLEGGGRALKVGKFGDWNDTPRVLVPAVFEPLGLSTAVIAMPRASVLLVADPKDETALEELTERLLQEYRAGGGDLHVVTWNAGKLTPYAPPAESRLAAKFLDLERSATQADVKAQTEALRSRLGTEGDAPFVASYFRVKNPTTQDEFTYVVHTEGVTTLLPRAEYVCFTLYDEDSGKGTPQACAAWDTVYARMKDRWKELPLHPTRWLVSEFPSAAELKAFGFAKKP